MEIRMIRGQYAAQVLDHQITIRCLACRDEKRYLFMDNLTTEAADIVIEEHRKKHTSECTKLVRS